MKKALIIFLLLFSFVFAESSSFKERIINAKKGDFIVFEFNKFYSALCVFNIENKKMFFVEVKLENEIYTYQQKNVFDLLKSKIIIALMKNNKIIYKDYKSNKILFESENIIKEKILPNINCKKCKYSWHTTSIAKFVSCPDCLNKVRTEKYQQ